ncbi:uncharacterized protein E5676_scaffold796G00100 [Cucumis melo var. makuwa]|uniref:Uncharacterized protein n=1 Tax=Cucumis melo var. makuwa TaxID=1194695 RepID=A0A5D3CBD3_CUCMM|nr:uncharacterized protein E5676_scaffold796G00100 [Cucumis melo var. makuwa]
MIRLELTIGDLKASALFHIIDSRITYKLLLGRLWIHGNGVESLKGLKTKDGLDPEADKLMAKVGYDFTAHIEFKSLKIHEQLKFSSIQKKLLLEGHAIPVSRKGLGYKLLEPICITRKRKEKVVDNNDITIEEVDSMEEKEGLLKVKRYDVILTDPEKEDSEQGEGETSCHHITIIEESEIETPEEDAKRGEPWYNRGSIPNFH